MQVVYDNIEHVLCALLLFARLGDIVTTYLVTPRLVLEANPIVRRLGWPFAIATLGVCVVPYVSTNIAVGLLMGSLLVSAGNAGRIWFARAMGEQAQMDLMLTAARRSSLSHALASVWASALFLGVAGGVVALFYPTPRAWGFWLAAGVAAYGVVIAVHGTLFMVRLFRTAASRPEEV